MTKALEALKTIAYGSPLDDCGNRNDDGINAMLTYGFTPESAQLQVWQKMIWRAIEEEEKKVEMAKQVVDTLKMMAEVDGFCTLSKGLLWFDDATYLDLNELISKAKGIQP